MKKILLFSIFLILGLVASQTLPVLIGANYAEMKHGFDVMLYICLAYIMINVGREFELDKTKWRSYTADYFIAMATAAAPWLLVCFYYLSLLPEGYFGDWSAWKETLLLSRYAAPTSAGILFTMLAGAGLKNTWVYQKTRVLAIFDDLDTILLMIPLQIFMIGMRWQLGVVVLVIFVCLWVGWKKLNRYSIPQTWSSILGYAVILVFLFQGLYVASKAMFGTEAAIHIEVLLPAFVLGMIIKPNHLSTRFEEGVSTTISYLFMFLVGMSAPLFVGVDFAANAGDSTIAAVGAMSWGEIAIHVAVVTLLSNVGKMVPMLFYRDRSLTERLALSIGMFTRGEVGAGIIFVSIGYGLGGALLAISLLSLLLNLILTGGFVILVKRLIAKAEPAPVEA